MLDYIVMTAATTTADCGLDSQMFNDVFNNNNMSKDKQKKTYSLTVIYLFISPKWRACLPKRKKEKKLKLKKVSNSINAPFMNDHTINKIRCSKKLWQVVNKCSTTVWTSCLQWGQHFVSLKSLHKITVVDPCPFHQNGIKQYCGCNWSWG